MKNLCVECFTRRAFGAMDVCPKCIAMFKKDIESLYTVDELASHVKHLNDKNTIAELKGQTAADDERILKHITEKE